MADSLGKGMFPTDTDHVQVMKASDIGISSGNPVGEKSFTLHQNYPNPFNPKTVISFQLAIDSQVELTIYNMCGQKIETLISGKKQKGYQKIAWDASALTSGIYFYRLKTENFTQTRKMALVK
jgi:hypothetical protein